MIRAGKLQFQAVQDSVSEQELRSISNQILSLAVIAKGFDKDGDWSWLFHATRSLYEQSNPHQLKPPIPITAAELFEWSLTLLNRIMDMPSPNPLADAMRFRQALMVGLLIARPVRVRAFMAMTISQHVEVSDHGMVLAFSAEDMKDRKARRLPLPDPLLPFMRLYLDVHRPTLLQGNESDALWISRRGGPMSIDSFTGGLAQLTNRVFGLMLRPHKFRHIAATSIAAPASSGSERHLPPQGRGIDGSIEQGRAFPQRGGRGSARRGQLDPIDAR